MATRRSGSRPQQAPPGTLWPRLGKDRAYKAVLSNRYLAEGLLRMFGPRWLAELLDFTTLREENPELIRGGLRARKADVLWSARLRDGGPRVYLLLEAQSTIDRWMALRMLDLAVGVMRKAVAAKRPGARDALPPVACLVVYSGERHWTAKRKLDGLLPKLPKKLRARQPAVNYSVLQLRHYRGAALEARDSIVAGLVRLHQCETLEDSQREIESLVRLTRQAGQTDIGDILADLWLNALVPEAARPRCAELLEAIGTELGAKLEGVGKMLKERKVDWIRDWREQGRAEGGIEALRKVVVGQAQKVYGRDQARDIKRLLDTEQAADRLNRIALWLVECDSAEDLMARIRAA